ncbi:hypothetical protein IV203_034488 [Nitzschia inconspicua]|uniref:Uncharacterized protein n=1 Tax=Nitzschia inconspicua TaxID=303405 RepID=A0A9K3LBH8_9STRA|nr:hypothetical protein IV203_002545 [Nitzschia inconspicua]KAG7359390.1 hypothetical protein IV203_034488 [Nitzschia inconspicua]
MRAVILEKVILFLIAFAVIVVWRSSWYLVTTTSLDDSVLLSQQPPPPLLQDPTFPQTRDKKTKQPRSDDPLFVLHIGPPKTATTTIQCGLHHLSQSLADEGFYFVGKTCPQYGSVMVNNETGVAGHHLLMGLNGGNVHTRGYIGLKERMDYHRENHQNMIYSNEGFAHHLEDKNVTWQSLQSLFRGWKVRIVIGYRHYFEWIRSLYYQQYLNPKKYKRNWPGQGKGLEHPSFLWYLEYHLHSFETGQLSVDGGHYAPAFGHHLSLSTYKKFAPHFTDIRFFNLYEEGDVVTNFVCNMLLQAPHTCETLHAQVDADNQITTLSTNDTETGTAHGLVKRMSKSFDAQRIAEAVYKQGMIESTIPKPAVVKLIEQRIQETQLNTDTKFLSCPSPSLEERFWNASVTFEREILALSHPDWTQDKLTEAQNAHRVMFETSISEGKFCEIDPLVVLQDEKWVEFLSKVGRQSIANETEGT